MSTKIAEMGELEIVRYAGKGPTSKIQIMQTNDDNTVGHVQLSKDEMKFVIEELDKFLDDK